MKRHLDDCSFLDRDRWDFQACPAKEAYEDRSYEYARQSEARILAVNRWRSNACEQSFEGYMALCRDPRAPTPPRAVLGSSLYVVTPNGRKNPICSSESESVKPDCLHSIQVTNRSS